MSDEEKKRIVSQPPPPTDEVDGEWGDDDDKTLVRELPEGVTKSRPAPSAAAVAETAVAPISVPAKAAEASTPPEMKAALPVQAKEEEADEDAREAAAEGEHEDEHEDGEHDDDDDDDDHLQVAPAPVAANDWIPEWAPFAVLALLVSVSILVGLGLVGGSGSPSEATADEPAAEVAKPAGKPSNHP